MRSKPGILASTRRAAPGGGTDIEALVLAHSPLVYYRFGDSSGTTATDSSGNGRHGAISGSVTLGHAGLVPGDPTTCFDFAGGIVEDDDAELYLDGLTAITVLCITDSDAIGGDFGIFSTIVTSTDEQLGLRYDTSGFTGGGTEVIKGGSRTAGGSGNASVFETANGDAIVGLRRFSMTWESGAAADIFINGSRPTFTSSPLVKAGSVTGVDRLTIARSRGNSWNGRIAEFAIIGAKLTDADIAAWDAAASGS